MGDFFAGPAEPKATSKKVLELVKQIAATSEGKGVEKWGSLGMCWGGKVRCVSVHGVPRAFLRSGGDVKADGWG